MTYTVMDLFSGVGGFSEGFRKVGCDIVLANEIDTDIAAAYKKNHPTTKMINADLTKIDIYSTFKEYKGNIDIIIGGPPCQGFSQKGLRCYLEDERNFLFRSFAEIVNFIQPKVFIMENVPNLLTTGGGNFKKEIYDLFEGFGYIIDSKILNAKEFGVPQARRRAFIIGSKTHKIRLPEKSEEQPVTVWDAISDLSYLKSGEGEYKQHYQKEASTHYQRERRLNSSHLYNHIATNHSKIALERMAMIPAEKGREYLPKEHLTKSIHSGTWSRMIKNEPSVTITTRFDTPSSGRFTHPYLNRAITVREAARIQSFDDTFIFLGPKTSQMKQVGNAVPPIMARYLAEYITKNITER